MTQSRNLVRIFAGVVLAVQAGVAAAHGSFPFDDPYWKRPTDLATLQPSAASAAAAQQNSKYDSVDNYNP